MHKFLTALPVETLRALFGECGGRADYANHTMVQWLVDWCASYRLTVAALKARFPALLSNS